MTDADFSAAERAVNAARMAFNIARQNLSTALSSAGAREGASDRLISHAEEWGLEHTVSVLAKTPAALDLASPIPSPAIAAVSKHLEVAHEANQQLDLAFASRESALKAANPSHHKAVSMFGKAVVPNIEAGTLYDRDTRKTENASFQQVKTEDRDASARTRSDRDRE